MFKINYLLRLTVLVVVLTVTYHFVISPIGFWNHVLIPLSFLGLISLYEKTWEYFIQSVESMVIPMKSAIIASSMGGDDLATKGTEECVKAKEIQFEIDPVVAFLIGTYIKIYHENKVDDKTRSFYTDKAWKEIKKIGVQLYEGNETIVGESIDIGGNSIELVKFNHSLKNEDSLKLGEFIMTAGELKSYKDYLQWYNDEERYEFALFGDKVLQIGFDNSIDQLKP